jgi:hypothetical protein
MLAASAKNVKSNSYWEITLVVSAERGKHTIELALQAEGLTQQAMEKHFV